MQYVRSISGSVSKAWNSVNPATLSGAIDVIVVEQENGDLACSPFHVRFGKFSLLRPYEKKVEFRVNDQKTDYAMKLGEGGEAFFVFETSAQVPESLQTSPLVSPAQSPRTEAEIPDPASLQEPDYLDIAESGEVKKDSASDTLVAAVGKLDPATPPPSSPSDDGSPARDWSHIHLEHRSASEEVLPTSGRRYTLSHGTAIRPRSPDHAAAVERALALSKKLLTRDIPTQITDKGDIMLDINGYKTDEEDSLQVELIARKILAEEMDGAEIGSLIGADRDGNVWIYASEEAKEAADREASRPQPMESMSDGGYGSDSGRSDDEAKGNSRNAVGALNTPPASPPASKDGRPSLDSTRNYAKTLRLTSAQLKSLNLNPGENKMTFTVNRATCTAYMYVWRYDTPIVISDIDGTITKSDALGHVLTMIGRDWTHLGVAKLYTDIAANGYHLLYLTSRSVGQADSTRNYLNGIVQDSYKLPKGPVIMSPDRTMAALRREVYLRKPEVFKMACLRDILNLFGAHHNPFYAGFGNRLTDALSYRSVNIPSTRIFTINSYAEVSLDLLTLTRYKSSYVNMRDLVDHFFPPVNLQVEQEFTDFNYWREPVDLGVDSDFTDSEAEEEEDEEEEEEEEDEEDEEGGHMVDSFVSMESQGYEHGEESEYDSEEDDEEEGESGGEEEEEDEEEDGNEVYSEADEVPSPTPSVKAAHPPPTTTDPSISPSSQPSSAPPTTTSQSPSPTTTTTNKSEKQKDIEIPVGPHRTSSLTSLLPPHPSLPKTAMKLDLPAVTGMLGQVPEFVKEEGRAVVEMITHAGGKVDGNGQEADGGGGKNGKGEKMATGEGEAEVVVGRRREGDVSGEKKEE